MNRLEIDLKKLRENDIPTDMATIPPGTWKSSLEAQRAIDVIHNYEELKQLVQKLELEEQLIAIEYLEKLLASRPKWAKKPGEVTETPTETWVNAGKV